VTIVALSEEPGIPFGVQLEALFQAEDSEPFQV
jgi:hypothetical protein